MHSILDFTFYYVLMRTHSPFSNHMYCFFFPPTFFKCCLVSWALHISCLTLGQHSTVLIIPSSLKNGFCYSTFFFFFCKSTFFFSCKSIFFIFFCESTFFIISFYLSAPPCSFPPPLSWKISDVHKNRIV